MGIVDITERFTGDEAQQTSPDAKNYTLTANRALDLTVDDPLNWNSLLVMAALADPQIRNAYPIDYFLRCDDLRVKKLSPILYEISAHYLTSAKLEQTPLDNPPDISYDSIVSEEEIDVDANGKPICTILGEDFDPPIRAPVYDTIVRISRNLSEYDDSWASSFRNRVNSTAWGNYAAGTVRVISLKGESVTDEDFQYWKVSGEFQIRDAAPGSTAAKAWYRRVQARGFYIWQTPLAAGKRIRAKDDAGADVTVPVLHDTTSGAIITDPTMAQWYEFQIFQDADINDIGLI